jgi:hypothetical protein
MAFLRWSGRPSLFSNPERAGRILGCVVFAVEPPPGARRLRAVP